jgi:leucyl-tRNA---protein transferase
VIRAALTRALAEALALHGPQPGPPFPCPYLRSRRARHVTLRLPPSGPGLYRSLLDLNFRRSGPVFYRPACDGCAECRMLRVPVADFVPSRAQRRALARNRDVAVSFAPPAPTEGKRRLFARYLEARHDGQMDGSWEEFLDFLYATPLETLEVEYRVSGRVLAAGIADLEPGAMSAVYCYFDPDEPRRSLGVLNVLTLIEESRRRGLPYLYLGYFVAGARTMAYKAEYRPCEVLTGEGPWERLS